MNSLGRHPSLKSREKENSSSRVYVLHKTSYTGILRRSCALTAKVCMYRFAYKIHCFFDAPVVIAVFVAISYLLSLVFQGNPMGVECSRKKTFFFYIY